MVLTLEEAEKLVCDRAVIPDLEPPRLRQDQPAPGYTSIRSPSWATRRRNLSFDRACPDRGIESFFRCPENLRGTTIDKW